MKILKSLARIFLLLAFCVILLTGAHEGYLRYYKGWKIGSGPFGLMVLTKDSVIGKSYLYTDFYFGPVKINQLVVFDTDWIFLKVIVGKHITDKVLVDVGGDDKVDVITTIADLGKPLSEFEKSENTVVCVKRESLKKEILEKCLAADEEYKSVKIGHNLDERVKKSRGKQEENINKKNGINL